MAERTSAVSIEIPSYVKVDGNLLSFADVRHAQAFIGSLQLGINEAIAGGGFQPVRVDQLQPPAVDNDGWIDRVALYKFFAQRYTDQQLHNRVASLMRTMYASAHPYYRNENEIVMFKMRCTKCMKPLNGQCADKSYHRAVSDYFAIKASSIIDGADMFHDAGVNGLGTETMKDFNLLVSAIQNK